jgi:hypothetical protein
VEKTNTLLIGTTEIIMDSIIGYTTHEDLISGKTQFHVTLYLFNGLEIKVQLQDLQEIKMIRSKLRKSLKYRDERKRIMMFDVLHEYMLSQKLDS